MINNVSIKYLWGIQDEKVSLTWSCTLMDVNINANVFDNKKIIIDFWMYQWNWKENKLNSKVDEELLNADFLIITHAHMDHVGRLPLLVKKWFKWRIIMTEMTKLLAEQMLIDYVTLTKNKIETASEGNSKNKAELRKILTILKLNKELINNWINKIEKEKIRLKIKKMLWNKTIEMLENQLINWWIDSDIIFSQNDALKLLKIQQEIEEKENQKKQILEKKEKIDNTNEIIKLNKELNKLNEKLNKETDIKRIKKIQKSIKEISLYLDSMVFDDDIYDLWKLDSDIEKLKRSINGIIWNQSLKNALEKANEIVNIFEKAGTEKVPELLYDQNDIYNTLSMIETLEVWNELDLDNSIFIKSLSDYQSWNFKLLDIPLYIKKWFKKRIYVLPHIKNLLVSKWKEEYENILDLTKQDKEFRNNLENLFDYVRLYESKKIETFEIPDWYDEKTYYDFCKNMLKENNIIKKSDIKLLRKEYNLRFTKKDIENAKRYLKVVFYKPNQSLVEAFKLKFYNAWHIEWSVQVLISLITSKVESLINWNKYWNNWEIKTNYENYLFTWDLWKFTDPNISTSPDIPDYKLDYVQCESTYALVNHPNKKIEFERFLHEINSTEWKVLIPAFSLQRTQEIIIELLNSILENSEMLNEYRLLAWKYSKKIKRYHDLWNKTDLTHDEQLKKTELFQELKPYFDKKEEISKIVLLSWLIVDSPLSTRISEIFMKKLNTKYNLLNPEIQESKFKKEVSMNNIVTYLQNREYEKLYSWKRLHSKDVIISSWWMLQWWAILNHLSNIISDTKSKIIFTWYQALWTLWREIKDWAKKVKIWWTEFEVKCKVVFIGWFSSHIWSDDLNEYLTKMLNYNKWAVLSLTHWWEYRNELRENIISTNKKVEVIVPKLLEKISLK